MSEIKRNYLCDHCLHADVCGNVDGFKNSLGWIDKKLADIEFELHNSGKEFIKVSATCRHFKVYTPPGQ